MEYAHSQLKQRNDGRYYFRIKLGERLYFDIYGKSGKEAKEKLRDFYRDKSLALNIIKNKKSRQQGFQKRKDESITSFGRYFADWMRLYKEPNCKYSTLKNLNGIFKNYISPTLGEMDIKKITAIEIQELIASIKSSCQRLKTYKLLKDLLNTARITGILKINPMEIVKRPKHVSIEQNALSHEEEKEFIERAQRSDIWAFYALILFEGLRPGEAKALRHCDIKDTFLLVSRSLDSGKNIV